MTVSIKRNIVANYGGQFYATLIGISMVPMYVRYMGAEAYGLVGFFAMLQVWFQLLDTGLTSAMARETACYRGGRTDGLSLRRLLRTLEGIFIGVALCGALVIIAGSGLIAGSWLKVQFLPLAEVQHALMLMAVIVALRFVSGLYRGVINGFEHLVWLSGFNVAVATARFVLVIPFLMYVGTSPTDFFSYQLGIALVELAVLVAKTYRLLPRRERGQQISWQWEPLRGVVKLSLSIAFTSTVWVLVTQTDKLLLSKMLPLTEYGYFSLAVLAGSGVMIIGTPISGAIMPRLTKLSAEGDDDALIRLYCNATQLVSVIAIPAALVLAFCAEPLLWAWTGDAAIAQKAAPVLTLYALGNGILALAAFPYYLQFAKGDLKLHVMCSALFVTTFIPMLLWATWRYGMVGAGYAWLTANLLPLVIWLPIVHRRFYKGLHRRWLQEVMGIAVLAVIGAALAHGFVGWPEERLSVALRIAGISLVLLVVAAAGSPWVRKTVSERFRLRFAG